MISAGKIIEYLDNGKFICGFITETQSKRVHLLNQNKREVNLPISRIIHCSESSHSTSTSRDSLIKFLQDTNENRNNLMEEINLEEIWDLICEEKNSSYDPSFLAELVFGEKATDDIISAFLRSVFLNKIFFKYKEGKIKAHSREQVELLLHQAEVEKSRLLFLEVAVRIIHHVQNGINLDTFDDNDLTRCFDALEKYYLFGTDAEEYQSTKKILQEAGLTRSHDPFHLLVKAGIWGPHENIPLIRSQLPVNFSLHAIQLAETKLQTPTDLLFEDKGRRDLTHLKPLTIDGSTTLDFDDAITVEQTTEGYTIGIHISDVAHYVKPGDALFQEAMNRGTSIYFPESQIPMLPRHLSQGICSLIQGEVRGTMSFMVTFNQSFEVVKFRIFPSIIRVARRLTYEEADILIGEDPELTILNTIGYKLRARRVEAGALLLPFPDVNIHIDSNGRVSVNLGATDTPARTLISEMMILANSEAAKYISDRMVPGLFRTQEPPKQVIVQGDDTDLLVNTRQRKQLSRGELLTTAKRHCGLGVNQYTTVTSPIRRLLDLVMQHQLHSVVRREEPRFTLEMCKDFSSIISRTLSNANNVKQQRHRYWLLKYLQERKGQTVDALVVESGPKRTMLLLTDILFDTDLPSPFGSRPTPGSIVKIVVVKSDPMENTVKFDWS